jgi:hypothetical protein
MEQQQEAPGASYMALCTANEDELRKGTMGYCVCCLREVYQVLKWIDDQEGRTAICPHCAIDAVVPESWIEDGGDPRRRLEMLREWHVCGFGELSDELLQRDWIRAIPAA